MASSKVTLPPGPKGKPFFGNTLDVFKDPVDYIWNVAKQFPGITLLNIAGKNLYLVSDAEMARQIFVTETDKFCKGPFYKRLQLLAGYGLLTSEGAHWKRQRRLAQPAFHKEKLQGFVDIFVRCADDLAKKWENFPANSIIKMQDEMGRLTLRIVGQALFSLDLEQEKDVPLVVKSILRFLNKRNYSVPRYPMKWPLPSHKNYYRNKARLDKLVLDIIDDRLSGKTHGNDLLNMFIEAVDTETNEQMTREHLRDEIMTILLAGFETSSVALMWTWYLLSQHPEVMQKMREEHENILGDTLPTAENLFKLEYTFQVINESMRIYPPVFNVPRQAAADVEMGGFLVPKGSLILTSVYAMHRSEKYWEKPMEFNPERFSKENAHKINKNAYIPFATGQRLCIGSNFALMEIAVALAIMARKFDFTLLEGYTPKPIAAITMNATEGMPMRIKQR